MYSHGYGYHYNYGNLYAIGASLPLIIFLSIFSVAASFILTFILTHKVYEKAGYSKWTSIIPFYNYYVLYKMAGINAGFFVLSIFFPVVNIYLFIELAQKFGKTAGFGVATFFFTPIFLAILGYGDAVFSGIKNASPAPANPATSAVPENPSAPTESTNPTNSSIPESK